jgi:hypothetical protein
MSRYKRNKTKLVTLTVHIKYLIIGRRIHYSIPSLVRASLVRGPSVVRGFEKQNFSSHPLEIASK